MESPEIWAEQVVNEWRDMGLQLTKGISDQQIQAAEKHIGFVFDPFFKALYRRTNGFAPEEFIEVLLVVWPLDQIIAESKYFQYLRFVGFADFMLNTAVYGFSKDASGVYKFIDLPDQVPEKIANSFGEGILMITQQDDRLF